MTIALVVKVNDGLVLASDSATTLTMSQGGASAVANIYNNANKVFNLYKGLPVGAMRAARRYLVITAAMPSLRDDVRQVMSARG